MSERRCYVPGCSGQWVSSADLGWCPEHFDYAAVTFDLAANTVPEGDCLRWTGDLNHAGYGVLRIEHDGQRFRETAHRVAYRVRTGRPIPAGGFVLRVCEAPWCANGYHVTLGDARENALRMRERRRPGGRALDPGSVREVRRRLAAGEHTTAIAAEYGVAPATIRDILYGKTWSRVR